MLALLGFATIALVLALILSKKMTPLGALIAVPAFPGTVTFGSWPSTSP